MQQSMQYDAVIIGFGKGGKTLAAALGKAGRRTALVEQSSQMYGGTCINTGCIPSKFLVHKARHANANASVEEKQAYYQAAVEEELTLTTQLRMKNLRKAEDTPNVTVITGKASLLSADRVLIEQDGRTEILEARQIFLNTGSAPFIPSVRGLKGNRFAVTSEGLLRQTRLPEELVIIGGGYIGVEFASIYAHFGSKVTMIQNERHFLPREDDDIARAVRESLENRGITIMTGVEVQSVLEQADGAVVTGVREGKTYSIHADTVLVATGRRPNTAGMGLENAGVTLTPRGGVVTDEHLRTNIHNIFAMGDVTGGLQFTYISLDDFRIVRSAVLGDGSYTVQNRGVIPCSVFLDPPFSRVGMSEREAIEAGDHVKIARLPTSAVPKTLVMQQPVGLLKAVIDEKTDLILGAHLFCEESHEIINMIKIIMDAKLPYTVLRDMIFTHPTMSEALNDLFNV